MKIYDNYELWNNYTFRQADGLTEDEIVYWSLFHRWPLVMAVYLSMGQIPYQKTLSGKMLEAGKRPIDPDKIVQLEDFENRLELAKRAAENGELVIEKIPDTRGMGHPYVEKLVPVRIFIRWARLNYNSTYKPLFDYAEQVYKSPEHTASGLLKGTATTKAKQKIQKKAEAELDAGCRCYNRELAYFLSNQKKPNGKPLFDIPDIVDERLFDHFNEAVSAAFKKKGIPLRNQPKKPDEPLRGKRFCGRPDHRPILKP